MKMTRLLALILTFAMLAAMLVACGGRGNGDDDDQETLTDEEMIEKRIEQFVTYYNDGDMEKVLTCLEAKTANAFKALMNILGGLAGKWTGISLDLKDLFALGVSTTSGDFMNLEIHEIVVDGEAAVATTTMQMPTGTMTIYFSLVYEREGWYIKDMTDKKPALLPNGDGGNNSNNNG